MRRLQTINPLTAIRVNRPVLVLSIWGLTLALSVVVIVARVSFSYDLGVLLPPPDSASERVLVERVGQSPGAQLLFVAVDSDSPESIASFMHALEQSPHFNRVIGGGRAVSASDIPSVVFNNRYLLDQREFDRAHVLQQFSQRASELRLVGGGGFAQLLSADPTLAAVAVLQSTTEFAGASKAWKTTQGETVIVVETAATAFDLQRQQTAVAALETIIGESFGTTPTPARITGIGYIGTRLEAQIRTEAQTRSILASIVLMLILVLAYRRIAVVFLAAGPLLSGALVALAVLVSVSQSVHGITLAFGFTLLGIGIDYPIRF